MKLEEKKIVSKDHIFIKEWKSTIINILDRSYPDIPKTKLDEFLNRIIDRDIDVPIGKIDNNHVHRSIDVDLLSVVDWYKNSDMIAAGYGTFFKNHSKEPNPSAVMLETFGKQRKFFKDKLKEIEDNTSYEYKVYDMKQLIEKLAMNSYYGEIKLPSLGAILKNITSLIAGTSQ